jgi:hypothetical protein
MQILLRHLWADDRGALISTEYLFVATIIVLGVIVGLTNLRDAMNVELSETGNAILALSQGFTLSGVSGAGASVAGSQAIDTPALLTPITSVPPSAPSVIDQTPCN